MKLKIRNPFDSEMKVYVQYKEPVGTISQLGCIGYDLVDCEDQSAPEIEVTCFHGHESSLTLLQVFFVDPTDSQTSVFGPAHVAECCHAGEISPTAVAQYSVMVRCDCLDTFTPARFLRGN